MAGGGTLTRLDKLLDDGGTQTIFFSEDGYRYHRRHRAIRHVEYRCSIFNRSGVKCKGSCTSRHDLTHYVVKVNHTCTPNPALMQANLKEEEIKNACFGLTAAAVREVFQQHVVK